MEEKMFSNLKRPAWWVAFIVCLMLWGSLYVFILTALANISAEYGPEIATAIYLTAVACFGLWALRRWLIRSGYLTTSRG